MERCACGRMDCDSFNRNFHRMLVSNPDLLPPGLGIGSTPNYRYWKHGNKTYEYTTQRADGNKFWAVVRTWKGKPGHRQGRITKRMGFAVRGKAKQRACDWYQKARGSATVAA